MHAVYKICVEAGVKRIVELREEIRFVQDAIQIHEFVADAN